MKVNLHIERLVLEGLALGPGEHLLVRAAAEAELSRLLTEGGLSSQLLSGGAMYRLSAPEIRLTGANDPGQLGRQVAQALYGSVGK